MHSDPTLTRLPVERKDGLYHVLRKKLRQNATTCFLLAMLEDRANIQHAQTSERPRKQTVA